MMMMMDVEKALKELKKTPMTEIERVTALTWGARAIASYQWSLEDEGMESRSRHFYEGENYRQEALEHASMAEDGGALMQTVHDEIAAERKKALTELRELVAAT